MCEYCEGIKRKKIRGKEYNGNVYTIIDNTLDMDITVDIYDEYSNHIIDYEDVQDFIEINNNLTFRKKDNE